jgi:hypothetical protein
MNQHWLFKRPLANESVPILELSATTHDELVRLMAKAIESVCRRQATLQETTKDESDERTTTS